MDLGKSCIELVQDSGNLQSNPGDTYAQRDLADHARSVNEKVLIMFLSMFDKIYRLQKLLWYSRIQKYHINGI